jgi:hypothetical protein
MIRHELDDRTDAASQQSYDLAVRAAQDFIYGISVMAEQHVERHGGTYEEALRLDAIWERAFQASRPELDVNACRRLGLKAA